MEGPAREEIVQPRPDPDAWLEISSPSTFSRKFVLPALTGLAAAVAVLYGDALWAAIGVGGMGPVASRATLLAVLAVIAWPCALWVTLKKVTVQRDSLRV